MRLWQMHTDARALYASMAAATQKQKKHSMECIEYHVADSLSKASHSPSFSRDPSLYARFEFFFKTNFSK
jgi:hypothetical protein